MNYIYGMRLRGFSIETFPKGGLVEQRDSDNPKYYDYIVYDRRLTQEELQDYELDFIKEIEVEKSIKCSMV